MIRLLIILGLFSFSSCEKKREEKKPTVLVSVPPYAYFVKKIAHDRFQVQSLVPSNANPHIYEPTPKEVEKHRNAFLWIRLGESFDKKVFKVFDETQQEITIVNVTDGIPLLSYCEEDPIGHCDHDHDEGKDLHIWLSPRLAKIQAQTIAAALIALFPQHKEEFETNLNRFLEELTYIDAEITSLLAHAKGKAILVSHPAFGYFCEDYGLLQISIEMEGKDPLPQQITEILQKVKQFSIQSILIEPQYSNKGAELIAERLHLPTHIINPYDENYAENILALANMIAE